MASVAAEQDRAAETGWIGGKRFDLFFFFGSALVAVAVGAFALVVPASVVPLFWCFLLFVEGPHLAATWARTYIDAAEWRRRSRLLIGSLAWLLPGLGVVLAAHVAHSRAPMDLFLLFAALWSFHHGIRQFYGILAIYHHHAQSALIARKYDRYLLHGTLWLAFGLFSFGHPQNRSLFGFPREFPTWLRLTGMGLLLTLGISIVAYGIFRRLRFPNESLRPLAFLLGPAIGLQCYAMFFIGAFEPLIPRPEDPEQAFLTTAVVGGTVHGLNYLGIVSIVGLRRHGPSTDGSLAAFLGKRPLLAYGAFVVVSLGYLALNAARGVLPGITPFARQSVPADLFLVLYWGVFFHHYYLDQHIWHVRSDETLRFELGLGAKGAEGGPKPQLSNERLAKPALPEGARA